ncbi:MAG TPA: ABC transporter ATP-binding protein, partial [Firmicutes bacterium]|nr:ABC transporter ATP-binding protein [Bacillota bacterium]
MLQLDSIDVSYGPVRALSGVSMEVPEGDIVALLGSNGAGKSTTLRAISGIVRPTGGTILFAGQRIDALSPERIVSMGIVQAPEGRQVL